MLANKRPISLSGNHWESKMPIWKGKNMSADVYNTIPTDYLRG